MNENVSRRHFLGISGAAAAGAAIPAAAALGEKAAGSSVPIAGGKGEGRPNIVIFMPDELRADALACYGNTVTRTPNFDRLAKDGARFEQCHVQYPICGPSRCSMLTGRPTNVNGHRSQFYYLRASEANLFRSLRRAGYDVFWYGKNDALAPDSVYDSVTEWNHPTVGGHAAKAEATGNDEGLKQTPGVISFLSAGGEDPKGTSDYRHLLQAQRILENKNPERPFCIFLPLNYPHPPYGAPRGFNNAYSPSQIKGLLPRSIKDEPAHRPGIRRTFGLEGQPESLFQQIRSRYYDCVSYSDWLLGELLDMVDKTGHRDDTAIFTFSDHGDYAGDYGLVEKWPNGLEDALTRVPFIARIPGGKAGTVVKEPIMLMDFMSTCLELAGAKADQPHFSRSLMPQLMGEPGRPREAVFAEGGFNVYEPQCFPDENAPGTLYYPRQQLQITEPVTVCRSAMVRTLQHKLIVRTGGQNELYAYSDGPEVINRYSDAALATTRAELQERLLAWYMSTGGVTPYDKDQREFPPFLPTASVQGSNLLP